VLTFVDPPYIFDSVFGHVHKVLAGFEECAWRLHFTCILAFTAMAIALTAGLDVPETCCDAVVDKVVCREPTCEAVAGNPAGTVVGGDVAE
jgi:hypothetical protein